MSSRRTARLVPIVLVLSCLGCASAGVSEDDPGYDVFTYRNITTMQLVRLNGRTGEVSIATTDGDPRWTTYPEPEGAEPVHVPGGNPDRYVLRAFNWERVLFLIRVDSHTGQTWYRVALDLEPWIPLSPLSAGYEDAAQHSVDVPIEERILRARHQDPSICN